MKGTEVEEESVLDVSVRFFIAFYGGMTRNPNKSHGVTLVTVLNNKVLCVFRCF